MGHEPSGAAEEPPIQAHPERRPAGDIRRLLLDVSRATVSHRDLPSLLRDVILTNGASLRVAASEFPAAAATPKGGETLEATEREAIVRALGDTNWVLSGPHGAAARLGLKRTTLQSRMRKLGIERAKA